MIYYLKHTLFGAFLGLVGCAAASLVIHIIEKVAP